MGTKKKLRLCLCSVCKTITHVDENGVAQLGCMVDLRKWKDHAATDELKAEQEDHVRYAALVASTKDSPPSRAPETVSTPVNVRPADSAVPAVNDPPCRPDAADESAPLLPEQTSDPLRDGTEHSEAVSSDEVDEICQRLTELSLLESGLCVELRLAPGNPQLVFQHRPSSLHDLPLLHPSAAENRQFLAVRASLEQKRHTLRLLPPLGQRDVDRRRGKLLEKVGAQLLAMDAQESIAWERQKLLSGLYGFADEKEVGGAPVYRTEHLFVPRVVLQPCILLALIVVSALHTLSGVSGDAANLILGMVRVVLTGTFIASNSSTPTPTPPRPTPLLDSPSARLASPKSSRRRRTRSGGLSVEQRTMLDSIPRDIRTALVHLNVQPEIILYATCPTCSQTYSPNTNTPDDPYPRHCTFQETDKPVCGAPLVRKVIRAPTGKHHPARITFAPLRPFPYHTLFSWTANLFSRRQAESLVENAWSRSIPSPGAPCGDILQSPAFRNFRGPNGALYSNQPGSDVHLVFGLFVDWFNPGGNKQAGKTRSVGAIYLVCYSLPPELRFLPEYISLLGIIPGPHEPSLHELNNFLRPLIDELLVLWHSGIRLSQTALHPTGRLVRAVIIPLICDLPALRKTAGFAGHSSTHFCSFCLLKKADINNLSRPWPSRTWKEHLRIASSWRDAPTESVRHAVFDEHGLRWSELLRLPYWDPTRYAVVDAMHNLFLGQLRHHCREVWGIDTKDKATTKATPHTPAEQREWLTRLVAALRRSVLPDGTLAKGSMSAISQPRKGYLVALAQINGIVPESKATKQSYASALLKWVQLHSGDDLVIPPVLDKATSDFHLANNELGLVKLRILTPEIVRTLRADMAATYLPSWIERPPADFGSPAHGKLKADHWRTVCTISMVITLVRIWSSSTATSGDRLVLENFVHLVVAVDLATRRSMTPERARLFDFHMAEYLRTLRDLFDHNLVPNHHIALHLTTCLLLFGPVRGWWGYPFERYNGIIQRLKTNNHIADIPLTFIRSFYSGAELRWLMSSTEWPSSDEFREVVKLLTNMYQDHSHGTRVLDIFGSVSPPSDDANIEFDDLYAGLKETRMNDVIYSGFVKLVASTSPNTFTAYNADLSDHRARLSRNMRALTRIAVGRVTYGTRGDHIRNSFVCFRNPLSTDPSRVRAGQISRIFLHYRVTPEGRRIIEPFVEVEEYVALTAEHAACDPYRKFPLLDAKLYYNRFHPRSLVVRREHLVSHFAAYMYVPEKIEEACILVRSLDRS